MIYLLGIEHDIQLGLKPLLTDKFIQLVQKIIKKEKINLVCEESSNDTLKGIGIKKSPLEKLCNTLKINYIACDPTDNERLKNKILSPEKKIDIMQKLFQSYKDNIINKKPAPEFKKLRKIIAKDDRKRELFWIKKIMKEKSKKTLFICGAGHINSHRSAQGKGFDKLLKQKGWKRKFLAFITKDTL